MKKTKKKKPGMWVFKFDHNGIIEPSTLMSLVDEDNRFVYAYMPEDRSYDRERGSFVLITNHCMDNETRLYFHTAKELTLYLSLFIPNLQKLIEEHGGVWVEDSGETQ